MNRRGTLSGSSPLAWLAVAWLAASCAYLLATRYPFTPDSFAYVAAAQSLSADGVLSVPFAPSTAENLPVPYAAWPPGLPVLIALTAAGGVDFWLAAQLVSAAGLAFSLLWMTWLLREREGGGAAVVLVAVTMTSAVVGSSAWSEGPFLFFVWATLWALYHGQKAERSFWIWLVAAGFAIAGSTLVRYAGVFLLPALLWHVWRQRVWMYRWAGTALALLAAAPLALWLQRNALLTESWRGGTAPAAGLFRGIAEFCAATGSLCVPPLALYTKPVWQAVAGLIVLGATAIVVYRRRAELRSRRLTMVAGICAASLAAAPLTGRVLGLSGVVDTRLIWPAFVVGTVALTGAWRPLSGARRWGAGALLSGYALVHALSLYVLPGVSPRVDALADAVNPLTADATQAPVLSNRAWLAWKNTGRPAFYPPFAFHSPRTLDPDTLRSWAAKRGVRQVLWYDEGLSVDHEESIYGPLARAVRSADTSLLKPRRLDPHVQVFVLQGGP